MNSRTVGYLMYLPTYTYEVQQYNKISLNLLYLYQSYGVGPGSQGLG